MILEREVHGYIKKKSMALKEDMKGNFYTILMKDVDVDICML